MNEIERLAAEQAAQMEEPGKLAEQGSTLTPFTEIIAKPVKWTWMDRIAQGKITALAGRPKIGKGFVWTHLAAAVTKGRLEGDLDGPRQVLVLTTEDEPGDTLKPRLLAAGADLSLVSMFKMGAPGDPMPFRVPQDAHELRFRVEETNAALVVIDPLIEFVDGSHDTHKSQATRQAVAAVNEIAKDTGCAILVVFHLNKGASTDPLLRHEGSAAFTQIVRAGMMLGHDPDDPDGEDGDQRVLAVSSSNLARIAPAIAYRIAGTEVMGDTGESIQTARITQIGESSASASDLLKGKEDDEARCDRDDALDFLRTELADGPTSAKEIQRSATAAGIGPWPLKAAKRKLGVRSEKPDMKTGWIWQLPEGDADEGEPALVSASPSSPSAFQAVSGPSPSSPPLPSMNKEGDATTTPSPSLSIEEDAGVLKTCEGDAGPSPSQTLSVHAGFKGTNQGDFPEGDAPSTDDPSPSRQTPHTGATIGSEPGCAAESTDDDHHDEDEDHHDRKTSNYLDPVRAEAIRAAVDGEWLDPEPVGSP